MNYELVIERKARKSLARLPQRIYERVMEAVYGLLEDPYPHNSRKLQNTENRRLRVGDYRAIYFVEETDGEGGVVYVLDVGHRREIYGWGFASRATRIVGRIFRFPVLLRFAVFSREML